MTVTSRFAPVVPTNVRSLSSHAASRRVINEFSDHQRYRGFSVRTIERRRGTLTQFARFLQPLTLTGATPELVEQFLSARNAPRTRHAYRSDLRVFYRWAVERNLIDHDPTKGVSSVKVPRSLPRPIDVAAIAPILLGDHGHVRLMVALAMFAGLRCLEIAQLAAEDVWLHVEPAMIVVRGGKGGADRSVPIHPALRQMLGDVPSSGPLFPGRDGGSVRASAVSSMIRYHFAKWGIAGTPHQLRHTFGTELARASGGDMVLTAALMGHQSMTTTMGYVRLAHSRGADIIGHLYGMAG